MQRAFTLGQSNEVVKSGHTYDLHNDYVPTAVVFDAQSNSLRVVFKRLSESAVGRRFALLFNEVDVLEFSGNLGAGGVAGLDEIGYKDMGDYDYDWLATETQSAASDHMIMRFDSGATLRVHSARADIVEDHALTILERDAV